MDQLSIYKKPELLIISECKKLKEYSAEEKTKKAAALVYKLLNLLGVNDGKTEHHTELAKFIISDYGFVTFEQIEKAFSLFIKFQFNIKPFQQLNAVVFGQVISEYLKYENLQLKNYRLSIQEKNKKEMELTQVEKDKFMHEVIEKAIIKFKETGLIEMHIPKYDFLDSKNKLQGDRNKDDWDKIKKTKYNSIKARLNEFYKHKKAYTFEEKIEIKNIIKDIKENKCGEIISFCKLELLEDYFNKIIKNKFV